MDDTIQWLQQIVSGQAPHQLKDMASKGLIPFSGDQMVRVVAILAGDEEEVIRNQALQTLHKLPRAMIRKAVQEGDVTPVTIRHIAHSFQEDEEILSALATSSALPDDIMAWLADRPLPAVLEALSHNQRRLRQSDDILARLIDNPRIPEHLKGYLVEERDRQRFKEKAVFEEEISWEDEHPELKFDEVLTKDFEEEDKAIPYRKRQQVQESRKKSIYQLIREMNTGERLILAMRGNREARYLLIRDSNKQVSGKVLGSPRLNDVEVEAYAKMTNVTDDVLRGIALKKEWMSKYSIVKALVFNPKCPVGISLPLVRKLSVRDMSLMAKNRNVPEVLRKTANRLYRMRNETRR